MGQSGSSGDAGSGWSVDRSRLRSRVERRKTIEREVDGIEARISEIDSELAEEDTRKVRLAELESTLTQLTATRTAQEAVLESRALRGRQLAGHVERFPGTLTLASLRIADPSLRPGSGPRLVCGPCRPRQ